MKPRIIYMGTPEFAVAPLDKLIQAGYPIAAVVTVPDKPSGRGLKIRQSDVKKYALDARLPVLQPVSLKDPVFLEELSSFNADLFIVVAFRMLPKVVWGMPPMGTFNLHGSLLPQYRGAAPINWAVINGENRTGVTTFMIDEKIDTGEILLQTSCGIEPQETAGSLHDKLMVLGADLVIETVKGLETGKLVPRKQECPLSGEQPLREAPKLTKELCRIRWDKSAEEIDRLVRGLSPYPAAASVLSCGDKTFDMKIFRTQTQTIRKPDATPHQPAREERGAFAGISGDNPEENRPGRIFSDHKTFISVLCGDGNLVSLEEIQLAGKKRMKVKEFLAGFRDIASCSFI